MAIRPVDLQLAYLAAPQNAAQVSAAQQAPQAAQQAAQAQFASELTKREETIEESTKAEGARVRADADGGGNGGGYTPQGRREYNPDAPPEDLAPGEHLIDFTA